MAVRRTLSQRTADKINAMVEDQYSAGDKIPNEMELAASIGVSRTTVREAIKQLCSIGLLEIQRGRGTYVRNHDNSDRSVKTDFSLPDDEETKRDIFEILGRFFPVVAELAADKADEGSIKVLHGMNSLFEDRFNEYVSSGEGDGRKLEDLRHMDVEFHKAVIEACDNRVIDGMMPGMINAISDMYTVWQSVDKMATLRSCLKYHPRITEAIEEHDRSLAHLMALRHEQEIRSLYMNRD